ncbi:MAG: ABC transporter permease [Clostridia bacterium]|jgi:peptide/nickel transport system permease protein|nr:ABC transporter permease [Clostridia bacterium]
MGKYILQRLAFTVVVIFCISIMVFVITHVVGNPVDIMLPLTATEQQRIELTQRLGLDQPLHVQLITYLKDLARLNFGVSWWQRVACEEVIMKFIIPTAFLVTLSCLFALIIGVPLGIISAYRPGSLLDRTITILSLSGVCLPPFWIGLMLMLVFAVNLGWFYTSGFGAWKHLILPMITLACNPAGHVAQIVRFEMLQQLNSLYAITARAKGVSEVTLLFKHCLKNIMVPTVTMLGVDYVALMAGGSATVEVVFGWPGFGNLITGTIENLDFPLLQAEVFFVAVFVCIINLLIDFMYTAFDPRIRF